MNSTTTSAQLQNLNGLLSPLRAQTLSVGEFVREARQAQSLLDALPPRYNEVLQNLLDRLESSALFTEESCSFSQKDLIDSLQMWMDKAALQLPASAS